MPSAPEARVPVQSKPDTGNLGSITAGLEQSNVPPQQLPVRAWTRRNEPGQLDFQQSQQEEAAGRIIHKLGEPLSPEEEDTLQTQSAVRSSPSSAGRKKERHSSYCCSSSFFDCSSSGRSNISDHQTNDTGLNAINHVSFREPPCQQPYRQRPRQSPTVNVPGRGYEEIGPRPLRPLPQLDKLGTMSEAQKAEVKMSLQQQVQDFAERALHGEDCQVVNSTSGQTASAKYVISADLAEMTITPDDHRIPLVSVQLGSLRFIADKQRSVIDDDKSDAAVALQIVPAARARLTREDLLARLAVLEFDVEGEMHALAVLVLLPSSIERDHFVMCLNVLRHFAQSKQAQKLAPA